MRARVVIGVLLVVALVSGCRQGEPPRPMGPPEPAMGAQAVYESPEAGFRFRLPPAWQGHYRIASTHGDDARAQHLGASHVVTFLYTPEAEGATEQPLLRLVVLPRDEWTRVSNSAAPATGTVVSEGSRAVYLAELASANPYDPASPDGRRFARMTVSLDDVKRGFAPR